MTAVSNRKKTNLTRGKQVLRYPLKMFAEGTDYLQIDMIDYVPVATRGQVSDEVSGTTWSSSTKISKIATDTVEGYKVILKIQNQDLEEIVINNH